MSGRLLNPVSVIFLLTAAWRTLSDDVPALNVEPVCRGIARQAADPSERGGPALSLAQCIKSEERIRQTLVEEWSSFAPADKDNCVPASQAGGQASYTGLLTCLEMARDARKMNAPGPSYTIER